MSRQHPSQQGHEPSHIYDALDTFTTNHGEPVSSDLVRWAGVALVGAFHAVMWTANLTVKAVSGLLNFMADQGPIVAGLVVGLLGYNLAVKAIVGTTTAWAAAQGALNVVMNLNPIGLLVALTGGLVTAYMLAKSNTDSVKNATDRLNEARREEARAADAAKDANNRLKDAHLTAEGAALAVEGAQRTYNDAVKQYGPNSFEARQAAYQLKRAEDDLKTANDNVRIATQERDKKEQEVAKKRDAVKKAEREKRDAIRATRDEVNRQRDALSELGIRLDQINGRKINYSVVGSYDYGAGPGTGPISNEEIMRRRIVAGGRKAQGTNYAPGGLTLVGERGPELINLPRGSQVMQAYRTRQSLSDGVSGGDTNININGTINIHTPEAADAFWNRVDKTQRLAKVGMA